MSKSVLKTNAIPSVFPNFPKHLASTPANIRQQGDLAEERRAVEEASYNNEAEEFFQADVVKSQTDIESVDCGGYKQVWDNSHLFFLYLAIDNLVPSVLASVSIAPDLHS